MRRWRVSCNQQHERRAFLNESRPSADSYCSSDVLSTRPSQNASTTRFPTPTPTKKASTLVRGLTGKHHRPPRALSWMKKAKRNATKRKSNDQLSECKHKGMKKAKRNSTKIKRNDHISECKHKGTT